MKNLFQVITISVILSLFGCNNSNQPDNFQIKLEIEKYQRLENSILDISEIIHKNSYDFDKDSIRDNTSLIINQIDSFIYKIINTAKVQDPLNIDIWNTEIEDNNYFNILKKVNIASKVLIGERPSKPTSNKPPISWIKIKLQNHVLFLKRQLQIPKNASLFHNLNTDNNIFRQMGGISVVWEDRFVELTLIQSIIELKLIQLEIKKSELQTLEIIKHFLTPK